MTSRLFLAPVLALVLSGCSKKNTDNLKTTELNSIGVVGSVCTTCNVVNGGTLYYIYEYKEGVYVDSMIVTNLPEKLTEQGGFIKFSSRNAIAGQDPALLCHQDRVLPSHRILNGAERIDPLPMKP